MADRYSTITKELFEFLLVVRCGSLNKAAKELNTTQPTLTRTIKRLEDVLEVPLLERSPQGTVPSDYGKVLLPYLSNAENQFRLALHELDQFKAVGEERLHFGSTPMLANKIIPKVLQEFVPRHPYLTLEFSEGLKPALLDGLKSGAFDFIMALSSLEEDAKDVLQQELFTDALVIIARPDHPLTNQDSISVSDIVQCEWIVPTKGLDLRSRLENFFRNEGHDLPAFAVETTLFTSIVALVKNTNRISAVPTVVVREELQRGELVVLEGSWSFIHRSFSMFFRRGHMLSPSARDLISTIKRHIDDLNLKPG